MPADSSFGREKAGGGKKGGTDKGSVSRGRRSTDSEMQDYFATQSSVLPPQFKARLNEWFAFIEGEFEALYAQNIALQEKVERLSERLQQKEDESSRHSSLVTFTDPAITQTTITGQFGQHGSSVMAVDSPLLTSSCSTGLSAGLSAKQRSLLPPQPQQLKMPKVGGSSKSKAAVKLRVQTSRIVSSFKTSPVQCRITRQYLGHRDGVWDVDTVYRDALLLATASAGQCWVVCVCAQCGACVVCLWWLVLGDQTACIWGAECGRVVLQYTGHSGSVNSIKFHPSREVVLSASGDHTAHVWQAAISHDYLPTLPTTDLFRRWGRFSTKVIEDTRPVLFSDLIEALDGTRVSSRQAFRIVATTASSLGHDPQEFVLNPESIRQAGAKYRSTLAKDIKETSSLLHLLPFIGAGRSFLRAMARAPKDSPSSSGVEKLLGVPKRHSGTGNASATTMLEALEDWGGGP
ncbi:WD40-repeat-containing domain [Trinorchestia longiramus]|nr:WD40-repeat-containing domain [Trinorchestia longiramus]